MSRLLQLAVLACASACQHATSAPGGDDAAPAASAARAADEGRGRNQEAKQCRARIAALSRVPALPGTPALEHSRGQLLGRAKATPVLFEREPRFSESDSALVTELRARLERDPSARTLGRLYHHFFRNPELARAVLLREGYLYTDAPGLAFALVNKVELQHLFEAAQIIVERGQFRHLAARDGKYYRWVDGPDAGQRARILLFDRVWEKGKPPTDTLHLDVEQLAEQLGFWRLKPQLITENAVVARLLYGDTWVKSLIESDGANLSLVCEVLGDDEQERVTTARHLARTRGKLLEVEQRAMRAMLREALPFDEPITEEGQEDGKLRPEWRGAYLRGEHRYRFNDDWYPVFDREGHPRVPQVCIDFITDTFERASGAWWGRRGEPRQKSEGGLRFDELAIDNKRSVERFVQFAWRHPEWFDVHYTEPEERFSLRAGEQLFEHLERHAARYRPGDIVNILGLRDDEKYHYHSFFVYKADPVTGMPIWLAGNAGRPRLRSWQGVLLSAPRRSIHSRVRPRLDWLSGVLPVGAPLAIEPGAHAGESG